jgi:uncharacterized protein YdaU (DUF1376 family)
MDMLGHNSAAYGEEMRERVETILGDEHETVFHYVQWHIGDYIAGTEGMPLETEGAYMRFLSRLYRRGKPLPDDDRFMSVCMDLSIRVWKRVKEVLISVGKIICRNGALTNARFEKERQRRAELIQKQSESARLRWEKQRAEKMGLAEVSPKFAGSLAKTSAKLSQSVLKKPNEINDSPITDHMLTNNQYPLTIKEEERPKGLLSSAEPSDPPLKASVIAREAFAAYNEVAQRCGLPIARTYTKARATALVLRVKEAGGMEGFRNALANIECSAFLQGDNNRGWKADLDFVMQPKSFAKLIDGGYSNAPDAQRQTSDKYGSIYDGVL